MLNFLKQILLWLWLEFARRPNRKALIDKITSRTRDSKRVDDIPDIRTVLDEVCEIPENFEDFVSFTGFDQTGNVLVLKVNRHYDGSEELCLDIDLPCQGQFSYHETQISNGTDNRENLCSSRRLTLYCHQPMKRWRLYFRGPMTCLADGGKAKQITISCFWQCLSDPYDYFVTPSCWAVAGSLSNLPWKDMVKLNMPKEICYEQLGEMRTRICIGDNELLLRFKCVKERGFAYSDSLKIKRDQKKYVSVEKTGLFFSSQRISKDDGGYLTLGYVLFPIGDVSHAVQKEQRSTSNKPVLKITATACGNEYIISESLKRLAFKSQSSEFHYGRFTVSEKPAFGIECFLGNAARNMVSDKKRNSSIPCSNITARVETLAVTFDETECQRQSLVGGKGSQLAIVRSFDICDVPNGFCLTTNAYMQHLESNPKLKAVVEQISNCIKFGKLEQLKTTCELAEMTFKGTKLSDNLKTAIQNTLHTKQSNEEEDEKKFAVRSSSVSEDGRQASSAGQLDTFLGIHGLENICIAVIECWASSVSYKAVEYRRQNGQQVTENMGVVVQEMVDSEVAGVLFTNNPVDGDETKLVINASYGLGEAVVSGKLTPDTIIVQRDEYEPLQIESSVGKKEFRITVQAELGTKTLPNADKDKNDCCLDKNQIEQLCNIGIAIQNKLEAPQDIEWAMKDGKFYILQTRPITAIDTETDDEVVHEFDTPIVSDIELVSPCNVQEALPGALSILCTDIHVPAVDRSSKYNIFSRLGLQYPIHTCKVSLSFGGLALFGVTPLMPLLTHGLAGEKSKSYGEFNILGMAVEEQTNENINEYYGRTTTWTRKIFNALREMVILNRRDAALYEEFKQKVETTKIGENAVASETLYSAINESLYLYLEMWRAMIYITSLSGTKNAVMMSVLKGSSSDMTVENIADIALLLSECKNVESAEVPSAVNDLARLIVNSDIKDTFLGLPLNDCDSFLRHTNIKELRMKYIQFINRHGHRCIKESDFFEKTWKQEPAKLMKTLKRIVQKGSLEVKQKTRMTIDELVDNLQTPLSPFKKRMMKRMFVKNAMDGVAERERAKSFAIKAGALFKDAYWRLADIMVREGRLPDQRLLFFMTHREIGILIRNRPVRLIRLAKRRMRLFPEMNKTKYEKINIGLPRQIEIKRAPVPPAQFELTGMPVCRGKTSGRACVVQTLDDADQILQGDILICSYTDVGWSPYFPLINGLVTELGGLISHGAVVARENGIPCIVNVANVTEMFTTGDNVALDGTFGTISKL